MEHNKIFEIMARQGKTGKDLAAYLKVTPQTVTNWKIGVSESYKKRLPEIAVFLSTTVEELAGISSPQQEETLSLTEHELRLVQAYRANGKMQEAVDTLLGIDTPDPTHTTARDTTSAGAYVPPEGSTPSSRPRVVAYGADAATLDAPKDFDEAEIDKILRKIKKIKKTVYFIFKSQYNKG